MSQYYIPFPDRWITSFSVPFPPTFVPISTYCQYWAHLILTRFYESVFFLRGYFLNFCLYPPTWFSPLSIFIFSSQCHLFITILLALVKWVCDWTGWWKYLLVFNRWIFIFTEKSKHIILILKYKCQHWFHFLKNWYYMFSFQFFHYTDYLSTTGPQPLGTVWQN